MKSNEMMKSLMKFVKKDCYKGQLTSAFSFIPSINMHIIFLDYIIIFRIIYVRNIL